MTKSEMGTLVGAGLIVCLWLAFWGMVIYVAWHFISKWW